VNVEALYVSQPDTGEQALEIAEALVRSGAIDVVVVDSVAALVPRAEIEGEMGDSHVGLQARLMSQALRKLSGAIKQSNTVMIFTNQLRQKIGVMFGNPETTSGGMALKFYASVRLDIRKIETLKSGNDMVGSRTRVTVKKNKVAPPFRVAEFDIMYNEGISKEGDVLDLGVSMGLVDKRGSYFAYNETRLGQGRENVKSFLREHPEIMAHMEGEIRTKAGLGVHNFGPTDGAKVVAFSASNAAADDMENDAEDYATAA
jgi:recombination protein RecA